MGRLIAENQLRSTNAKRDALTKATAYLDSAARRFARTPAGTPPVRGVIANLSATFGRQLTGALALRLAQQRRMPQWQALSTLGYLAQHRDPSVVPALVRFAAQVRPGTAQSMAIGMLRDIGGSAVARAIRAEQRRMPGGQIPQALAALVDTGGATARA